MDLILHRKITSSLIKLLYSCNTSKGRSHRAQNIPGGVNPWPLKCFNQLNKHETKQSHFLRTPYQTKLVFSKPTKFNCTAPLETPEKKHVTWIYNTTFTLQPPEPSEENYHLHPSTATTSCLRPISSWTDKSLTWRIGKIYLQLLLSQLWWHLVPVTGKEVALCWDPLQPKFPSRIVFANMILVWVPPNKYTLISLLDPTRQSKNPCKGHLLRSVSVVFLLLWFFPKRSDVMIFLDSGDSGMYPYQRTPMGNPYIRPI